MYLAKFVRVVESSESLPDQIYMNHPVMLHISKSHPILFLFVLRELVIDLVNNRQMDSAAETFDCYVYPLLESASEFTSADFVEDEVLSIKKIIDDRNVVMPSSGKEITDKILDYIRLYFPTSIGHFNGDRDIWNLVLIMTDDDGNPIFVRGKRKKFRCLACQWEGGSSTGISSMPNHFKGVNRTGRCTRVTPNICSRLNMDVPAGRSHKYHITPYIPLNLGQAPDLLLQPPPGTQSSVEDQGGSGHANIGTSLPPSEAPDWLDEILNQTGEGAPPEDKTA